MPPADLGSFAINRHRWPVGGDLALFPGTLIVTVFQGKATALMDSAQFQRASQVFLAARRQHDPVQREAFVREQCGSDASLLAEVMRLLGNDAVAGGGTLDGALAAGSSAIGIALRAAAEEALRASRVTRDGEVESRTRAADSNIGKRIGRYRVIRRIGEGGMGAVYLAEQENPRRQVALKIIRPGVVSPSLLRRFELEAQVLGRLQHPGIAQIFEAGAHDSGDGAQPYFAMEFVDGAPLNVFADERALGLRDRLTLLAAIADAVEHAHQRGVIHRDLKPGNILVERPDETTAPQPKILDFGVARAIDSDLQATTLQTAAGQIIGTVAYMSPEQASGKADDIDTRSDVYALGVIGYELLSGKPPHDLAKRTVPDALRTIIESDPTRLGAVRRELHGDIETIIARAMEKDRARRYQSAAELAADIRRYLRDEPIVARPASTMYQLRKFARRNKALVGGLAAVFIVLVAGIIGTSIGLQQALGEARKAQRMNEYLRGMIAFLDPSVTKNNQVTLRNVLDDASRRVDSELGAEPMVASEILLTIARGYGNIGEHQLAAAHGHRALELLDRAGSHDQLARAAVWELIGLSHFRSNQPVEAEKAYRMAFAINRQLLGDAHPDSLGNIRDVIHALEILDRESEVDELVDIAVNSAKSLPAVSDDQNVGLAYEAIADILGTRHRMAEAEKYYALAIAVLGKVRNSDYAAEQCIVSIRNLSFIVEMQGRGAEAEELNRRAVEMSRERYGLENDVTLISMQGWLRTLRALGRLKEAEEVGRQSVAVTTKLYGEDSIATAHDLHNLAMVIREQDRPGEAIPLFEKSLSIRRAQLPPDDPDLGRTLAALGMAMVDVERGSEAVPLLREALPIRIKHQSADHVSVAMLNTVLGAALVQTGSYEEAERLLVEAFGRFNGYPAQKADAVTWLVKLYDAWGRPERAAPYRAMLPQTNARPASTRANGE